MNEFMKIALKESQKAYKANEIPVGAVIVKNDRIIAKSHNTRQKSSKILGHAEINCILKAEKRLKDWRLDECTMYVTLQPCKLCQYVIKESRLKKIYYLLQDDKNSINSKEFVRTNDCSNIEAEYIKMFNSFFEKLRKNGKN